MTNELLVCLSFLILLVNNIEKYFIKVHSFNRYFTKLFLDKIYPYGFE